MRDSNDLRGWATLNLAGHALRADLRQGISLALEQRFDTTQPAAFGAAPARSEALDVPGFTARVATGASCNCSTLTLTPHCNGTHTECVGHLTVEPLDAQQVVPTAPLLAVLLTVSVVPEAADRLVTHTALAEGWQRALQGVPRSLQPRALIVRTLPNDPGKRSRNYDATGAAYLTPAAAHWLVEQGIEHLIVDLPSLDRMQDGGALAAHRIFFGLPAGGTRLADAQRAHCTATELAFIPDDVHDGLWLLWLQVPALAGDAVPSRPLLHAVQLP
ncbi:MAG: cyclase family protein [Steroidobacteraceae bacterium]